MQEGKQGWAWEKSDDNGSGDNVYRPEFTLGGAQKAASNSSSQKMTFWKPHIKPENQDFSCPLNSDSCLSLCIAIVILKGGGMPVCYCNRLERY